nr:probable mitochondrial saccharopine dehydrogenase-like oxidoreductase At5g39410 [Ipomoea trifida]
MSQGGQQFGFNSPNPGYDFNSGFNSGFNQSQQFGPRANLANQTQRPQATGLPWASVSCSVLPLAPVPVVSVSSSLIDAGGTRGGGEVVEGNHREALVAAGERVGRVEVAVAGDAEGGDVDLARRTREDQGILLSSLNGGTTTSRCHLRHRNLDSLWVYRKYVVREAKLCNGPPITTSQSSPIGLPSQPTATNPHPHRRHHRPLFPSPGHLPGKDHSKCVGSFHLYGEPVVAACVDVSCDYLDITGEMEFVERMEASDHDRAAKKGSLIK